MSEQTIRKPSVKDAPGIQKLIQHYSERQFLLPRTLSQVIENLRDFIICEQDGEIIGCVALHLWSDLAEVRSLAVAEHYWRRKVGTVLIQACIREARELGVATVFALTYQPEFFERMGFKRAGKERFPHKIWVDCANCPHFPNCNEVALVLEIE